MEIGREVLLVGGARHVERHGAKNRLVLLPRKLCVVDKKQTKANRYEGQTFCLLSAQEDGGTTIQIRIEGNFSLLPMLCLY